MAATGSGQLDNLKDLGGAYRRPFLTPSLQPWDDAIEPPLRRPLLAAVSSDIPQARADAHADSL